MPQPRQLSAYDPEWEEDPHFTTSSRKAASAASQSKKLPSPAVLRDILSELTDKQRSEEHEMMQASAPVPIGDTTHLRYLGTSTSMTFEGEMDAIASVVSNDVGRSTYRKGELTAAMACIVPEPDLVRVNAGTGSKLQLDSVWMSRDATKPAGGDQALYAAPLLATMGGYQPEAYPEAVAKRRVMNLVQTDAPSPMHGRRGGKQPDKVIVFRSKKEMYEPRARQLMSAEERAEEEMMAAMAADAEVSAGGGRAAELAGEGGVETRPVSTQSAMSDGDRAATLSAAAESPGVGVSFDLSRNRVRGKRNARRQQAAGDGLAEQASAAPRLSFAERFGGIQPGDAGTGGSPGGASAAQPPADDALTNEQEAAVLRVSPRNSDTSAAAAPGQETAAPTGAATAGSPTRVSPRLGDYSPQGQGPYRLSRGGTQAAYAAGGLSATASTRRRIPPPNFEKFDVRSWSDGQRRATEAPTLRHFYSEIRTID